ncbi:MAG: lysylphosphatidylglycerol synthase transmembrane domain-containing protein [Candidatus Dormibacterales bacterium]
MTNRPPPPPLPPVSGARPARLPARLRVALQTSAGLALLAFWLHSVPIAQVWRNARPHHLWPLALIAFCTVASALLRAGRWKLLMRPVLDLPASEMFWVNSAGNLANYLLPLRAGDAIRFFWIGRRHPVPAGACLSSMMLDKAFDVAAMAAFLIPAAALQLALHGPGDPLARVLEVAAAGPTVILVALVAGIRLGPRLAASGPAHRIAGGRLAARAAQEAGGFAAAG